MPQILINVSWQIKLKQKVLGSLITIHGRKNLFHGWGGLSKNAGCYGWPTKKHLAKTLKTRFKPKYKLFKIRNIWNSIFEYVIPGIKLFYIRPYVPVDMIRFYFNFRFSSRKS